MPSPPVLIQEVPPQEGRNTVYHFNEILPCLGFISIQNVQERCLTFRRGRMQTFMLTMFLWNLLGYHVYWISEKVLGETKIRPPDLSQLKEVSRTFHLHSRSWLEGWTVDKCLILLCWHNSSIIVLVFVWNTFLDIKKIITFWPILEDNYHYTGLWEGLDPPTIFDWHILWTASYRYQYLKNLRNIWIY